MRVRSVIAREVFSNSCLKCPGESAKGFHGFLFPSLGLWKLSLERGVIYCEMLVLEGNPQRPPE